MADWQFSGQELSEFQAREWRQIPATPHPSPPNQSLPWILFTNYPPIIV
jgi:hypothetical protein